MSLRLGKSHNGVLTAVLHISREGGGGDGLFASRYRSTHNAAGAGACAGAKVIGSIEREYTLGAGRMGG